MGEDQSLRWIEDCVGHFPPFHGHDLKLANNHRWKRWSGSRSSSVQGNCLPEAIRPTHPASAARKKAQLPGISHDCPRPTFTTSPRHSSLGTLLSVTFSYAIQTFSTSSSCRGRSTLAAKLSASLTGNTLYSAHVSPRRRSTTPPALRWWRFKIYGGTLSTRFQRLESCRARSFLNFSLTRESHFLALFYPTRIQILTFFFFWGQWWWTSNCQVTTDWRGTDILNTVDSGIAYNSWEKA